MAMRTARAGISIKLRARKHRINREGTVMRIVVAAVLLVWLAGCSIVPDMPGPIGIPGA